MILERSRQLSRVVKILIWVGVFVLLAFGAFVIVAETYLRSAAEAQIAKDLKRYYNVDELPAVEIHCSPFFWCVLTGSVDSVDATMTGLDTSHFASGKDRFATPMRISSLTIDLRNISFSPLGVLNGQKSFSAESGTLAAHVTAPELNAFMKNSGVRLVFDIKPGAVSATANLAGQGETFTVVGTGVFALQGSELIYDPVTVEGEGVPQEVALNALRIRRNLPTIGGITPTSLEMANGEIVLSADVSAFTFEPIETETGGVTTATSPTETPTPSEAPPPSVTTSKSPTRSPSPSKTPTPTKTRR